MGAYIYKENHSRMSLIPQETDSMLWDIKEYQLVVLVFEPKACHMLDKHSTVD